MDLNIDQSTYYSVHSQLSPYVVMGRSARNHYYFIELHWSQYGVPHNEVCLCK